MQRSGLLDVGHGHRIHWETSGRADAVPALWLHGGPGSGLRSDRYRGLFADDRFLVVGVDQRGCGRSRPLATEPGALVGQDSATLIRDLEAVREHLGIERWMVTGGSWGSTLALAYAQEHPERVLAIGLAAVMSTSRGEVDWITEGVGAIFPEAWQRFEAASGRRPGERVVEAYARRLAATDDPADRVAAADDWDAWESTHVSLDPAWRPGPTVEDPADRLVFATLVTRYWAGDGLLPGGAPIAERMERIAAIPAVLVHGRHDISGPVITAWALHRVWPASELIVIEEEGHGGPAATAALRAGLLRLTEGLG